MASREKYHCVACNASFPYPSKLRRHLKTRKHRLEVITDNDSENEELMMNSDTGEEALESSASTDQPESEVSYTLQRKFYRNAICHAYMRMQETNGSDSETEMESIVEDEIEGIIYKVACIKCENQ